MLAVALTVLLVGCMDQQSMRLQADLTTFVADGLMLLPVTADVVFRDQPLPDGSTVTFHASPASLFAAASDAVPQVVDGRAEGASDLSMISRGGKVGIYVLAPTTAQPITLQASAVTVNGDAITDTLLLVPKAPPLVAAGRPATANCSGAITQDEKSFDFTCTRANIGAFVSSRPTIKVACKLTLRAEDGRVLPHTPLKLLSEAGALVETPASTTQARAFTYVVTDPPSSLPSDVAPMADETNQHLVAIDDTGYIPNAVQQNPRDGLVTLLVVARGHEAFQDLNNNHVRDDGEPFCDEGEPFLDVDDDGVYTAGRDVACCDNNGNGQVDGPNGRWDSDIWLGRMTHVLWSGPAEAKRSGLTSQDPAKFNIPAGGQAGFDFWAVDRNFNPLASAGSDDAVWLSLTPASKVDFGPGFVTRLGLSDTHGMVLVDRFPYFRFGAGAQSFKRLAIAGDIPAGQRAWSLMLHDLRATRDDGVCETQDWILSGSARATPAADYDGGHFPQAQVSINTSGKLMAKPAPCP